MKKITGKQLDSISGIYNEEKGFEKRITEYKIRSISPYLKGERLLDAGCGVGLLCKAFAPRFKDVVGVDGSLKKIKRADKYNRPKNVTYKAALFDKFNPSSKFDTIIAANILEHVESPARFLNRLREMLSPKGKLIIVVPNALGLHKRIGMLLGINKGFFTLTKEDRAKGHLRIYDRKLLEKAVKSAGLCVCFSEGIFLKPLSNKQMESWDRGICDSLYKMGKELPDYCSSILVVAQRKNNA